MTDKQSLIKLVLFCYFIFFILPKLTFAQQVTLSLSPQSVEVLVKPNKTFTLNYHLENKGDPVILTTKVLPFAPLNNLGNIKLKEELEGPLQFVLKGSDISLNKPFLIKSRESKDISLQIQVPESVLLKDYYYTLLFESQSASDKGNSFVVQNQARLGSNILIMVSETKNIETQGKIIYFDIIPSYTINFVGKKIKIFDSSDRLPVVMLVENKGNNLLKPKGSFTLKKGPGEKNKYEVVSDNILAHSERLIKATPSWQTNCLKKQYQKTQICQKVYSLVMSGFFFGRYDLHADINFGDNSQHSSALTTFVVLPIKFFFSLLLITFCSILILRYLSYIIKNRYAKNH